MFCPVGSSEEFLAVFKVKFSQIYNVNDKNPEFFNFQNFYAFFVKASTDYVN